MEREVKRRLAATGTKVLDLEVFWMAPDFQIADHIPALALGGELGARHIVVICEAPNRRHAHLSIPERARQTYSSLTLPAHTSPRAG